eukprot:gene11049-3757_t
MSSNKTDLDTVLREAIKSANWEHILQQCEDIEFENSVDSNWKGTQLYYSLYLFTYFIQNDLDNARFLWKRIPVSTKKIFSKELGETWNVGKLMWQRDVTGVYKSLSGDWPNDLQPVVNALRDAYSNRMLHLVSKGYSNITLNDFSDFIGVSVDEAKVIAGKLNWNFDNTYLEPKAIDSKKKLSLQSSLDTLSSLSEKVLFLEIN